MGSVAGNDACYDGLDYGKNGGVIDDGHDSYGGHGIPAAARLARSA